MLARPRTALLAALFCLAGLVACGVLAELVPATRLRDSVSLHGFTELQGPRLSLLLDRVAHLADPDAYGLLGGGIELVALARRRWRLALALPVVLLCAPLTTEILKQLTASPRATPWSELRHIAEASWPSGHSTGAMTLALCGVLAAPARLRPLVAAVGVLFAITVGYAVLVLAWHFPSDVIGGYLVAAIWTLLAIAAVRRWPDGRSAAPPPRRREPQPAVWPALVVALGAGAIALAAISGRPRALADYAGTHPSFAIAAVAIALLGAGLAGALVLITRSG